MKYSKTVKGTFVDRPNRFIAHVEIEGKVETVHVKNTGRCKELLLPGVTVILEDFRDTEAGKNRKTKFDLIAVYKIYPEKNKSPVLINMDSQAPNKVVYEWLISQKNNEGKSVYDYIKPEYTFGASRVDFYAEKKLSDGFVEKFLIEVKGCTLEKEGIGYFPDAPTERGVKHLRELKAASQNGYKCFIAFVIQIPNVEIVKPNMETHKEFGIALQEAVGAGVEILYLRCNVEEGSLEIVK